MMNKFSIPSTLFSPALKSGQVCHPGSSALQPKNLNNECNSGSARPGQQGEPTSAITTFLQSLFHELSLTKTVHRQAIRELPS